MTKTKLKVKVDIEFEIELSTKRKTCTVCNGAGQIKVDDPDIKTDLCNECCFSGDFYAQIDHAIENQGNEYCLDKYLSPYDFAKIQLLNKIIRLREEFWSYHEQQPYEDPPRFSKIERI